MDPIARGRSQNLALFCRDTRAPCRRRDESVVDDMFGILPVENNPNDAYMALHAFKKRQITSPIRVAGDGEESVAWFLA